MGGKTESPARSAVTPGIPGPSGAPGKLPERRLGQALAGGEIAEVRTPSLCVSEGALFPPREPGGQGGCPRYVHTANCSRCELWHCVFYRIEHSQATVTWRSGPTRAGLLAQRGGSPPQCIDLARGGGCTTRAELLPLGQDGARDWGAWGGGLPCLQQRSLIFCL